MKRELDKSKASYKLDLIETANADPIITAADMKLLAAYVAVMAWPSCKTWLVEALGRAMTGLSHGQFWKSRARLLGDNEEKRAYLIAVRQGGKVRTYKLINPWRDEARELVAAKLAYHREVDRQRQAAKRPAPSLQNLEGQKDGCPSKIWSPVPPENGGNTPLLTPPKIIGRDEPDIGSNVLPFNPRKAS